MKGGILAAFLAGEGIVAWRIVHKEHRIPAPGALLAIGALFVAGALVAEWYPPSEKLILAVLVGLDVAALMNVLPAGLGGQIAQADTAAAGALSGKGTAAPKAGTSGSAAGEGNLGPLAQGG